MLLQYDGEIAYLDSQMAELFEKLRELKIYDNTMIIITADHGEFFGEHGFQDHGYELYEEVLKIPLIIKYPSAASKKGVYEKKASLVDIMPTILNFVRIPLPGDIQGTDLFADTNSVLAEIYHREYPRPGREERFTRELKAVYMDNYKFIKDYSQSSERRDELYDLERDAYESHNIIDDLPEQAKAMEKELAEWYPPGESQLFLSEPAIMDQSTREGLQALGYLSDED
jgi:arylsulfatase A-like enzyme